MAISAADRRRLARKYAPHWRFNEKMDRGEISGFPEGDPRSSQNLDEHYFPMSVDRFVSAVPTGDYEVRRLGAAPGRGPARRLTVTYPLRYRRRPGASGPGNPFDLLNNKTPITEADELGWFAAGTEVVRRVEETLERTRQTGVDNFIRLCGYPRYMVGEPASALTYYGAYCLDGEPFDGGWGPGAVAVGYYLFYPYDTAGRVVGLEVAFAHRSDWENVTVVVSDPGGTSERLHGVVYYGHHMAPKWVANSGREGAPRLPSDRPILGTGSHPEVYVSWGTHACYPEPGVIYDLLASYDEFFNGRHPTGIRSWQVGLADLASARWNDFVGMWGDDGTSSQGSALSPRYKGRWRQLSKGGKQPEAWSDLLRQYGRKFQPLS